MTGRPAAVVWCERIVAVALMMRVGTSLWGDGKIRVAVVDAQIAPGVGIVTLVAGILAPAVLALWATRRASRPAVWFFGIWVTLLAVGFGAQIALGRVTIGRSRSPRRQSWRCMLVR